MIINPALSVITDCEIDETATIYPFTNLYGCKIGPRCKIFPFVEIGRGVEIGEGTKVSTHSYIPPGVSIGKECFIAHGVYFTNDIYTDVPSYESLCELTYKWTMQRTVVGDRVRIGSGCVILPIRIGNGSVIGAGAVVTKDVLPYQVVAGVPARVMRESLLHIPSPVLVGGPAADPESE